MNTKKGNIEYFKTSFSDRNTEYLYGDIVKKIAPEFDFLLNYFEDKTKNQRLPSRKDFNPADLKKYLPYVNIMGIEYSSDQKITDILLKLIGTEIAEFYGEKTGESIKNVNNEHLTKRVFNMANFIVEKRIPAGIIVHKLKGKNSHIKVMGLYVPLSNDNQVIDQIFNFGIIGSALKK